MKIAVISTGDELLKGTISDTNASFIASAFDRHGYAVERITAVGDDLEKLTAALQQALGEFDLVTVSGGLGPTVDDLTAQAAARASGRRLVRHPEAVSQIEAVFQRFGFPMAEINLRQADLPEGARVLENRNGTAPGFTLEAGRSRAFFFPGPPRELQPMFEEYVLGALPTALRERAIFRCYGTGESDLQTRLAPVARDFPGIRLSFRVTFPEISLGVTAQDGETLQAAVGEIRRILGRMIVAEGEVGLPEALGQALRRRGFKVATAESCTGGLIGHALTEVAGSSDYYLGGIVAYDNRIKVEALGVDAGAIAEHGAVSEPVVRAMAEGARRVFGADLGLATSGIAGPGGGTDAKPVGLVHLAVDGPAGVRHAERRFGFFGRSEVKKIAAWAVMRMALDATGEE